MKKKVGMWIDHQKAFCVSITGERERLEKIESHINKHVRLSGGSRSRTPFGPQDVASEKKTDEKRKHQLKKYCQRVISFLEDADRIFIFGPGEAKREIEKEIRKKKGMADKIAGIEAADKMSEAQIAAKVRGFYAPPS